MGYTDIEWKFKRIGKNVQIGKNVYIRYPEETEIGDNVIIDEFCYFTTSLKIGNNVHIAPMCSVIGGKSSLLVMEDFSGFAAGVRVICSSDDFFVGLTGPTIPAELRPNCVPGTIIVKRHGLLGTNSVVHPGVVIAEGAATGSMTLVTKSLEPWMVYKGIPAKPFAQRDSVSIKKMEIEYLTRIGRLK